MFRHCLAAGRYKRQTLTAFAAVHVEFFLLFRLAPLNSAHVQDLDVMCVCEFMHHVSNGYVLARGLSVCIYQMQILLFAALGNENV